MPDFRILAPEGRFTYAQLDRAAARVAEGLLAGAQDLREARVAFCIAPGFAHLAVTRGIWRAGGIAVPLAVSHPPAELDYAIRDAGASIVIADGQHAETTEPLARAAGARFISTSKTHVVRSDGHSSSRAKAHVVQTKDQVARTTAVSSGRRSSVPDDDRQFRTTRAFHPDRRALIVYTSGTTGRPKGVVSTHANLAAQVQSLVTAWEWTSADRTLLVLPLHHVHGIVNVVGCATEVGATLEIHDRFDAEAAWARLASGDITVFTAVPTIYRRLIQSWDAAPPDLKRARSEGSRRARLMMCGSAALPAGTLERWRELTGHTLLERYGMTELGMALANPLHGERRPGHVGQPLPGVETRIVDDRGAGLQAGEIGELEVRGPNVFLEYWRRPQETAAAFHDGWFRTGDVAVVEHGSHRLLGRTSVDIIKTGGYKVSALEIEDVVRQHPAIADCAVVGARDEEWGERVCVAVELRPGVGLALSDLQAWARSRLAPYKLPRALCPVTALPRNAMGKVVKPELLRLFKETEP